MNSSQQQLFFVCDRKDVPDDSAVAKVFRESVKDSQPCDEQWAATSSASSREPGRSISMHISRDMVGESTHMQLIFVEGISEYKEKYLYMYIWIFIYKYSFIYRNDAGWDLRVITGLQKPGSREISEREDDSDGSHSSFPVLWRQKILRVRDKLTCFIVNSPGVQRVHLLSWKHLCVSGVSSALWTLFKTLCLLERRPGMNRQLLKVLKKNSAFILTYSCLFLPDM